MESVSSLLLLRGLVREQRHWDDFLPLLRTRLPAALGREVTIECVDLPGAGEFYRERSPLRIADYTEFVRRKSRLVAGGQKPLLFSVSMGGMIALDWTRRYPVEVRGAVLMNSSVAGLSPFYDRLQPKAYPHLLHILRTKNLEDRERKILDLTTNMRTRKSEIARRWAEIARERPVSYENALRQVVAASRFRLPTGPPIRPLLLLRGLGDQLVDPRCSAVLAEKWGLPLRSHPQAGHDLTLDAGEWVIDKLIQWLSQPAKEQESCL